MRYSVRHITRFAYDAPVTESVMEARMQPRGDGLQRCLHFALTTTPAARVMTYQDHDGNNVHFFNIPARHARLTLTAEAVVECTAPPMVPHRLGPQAWARLDAIAGSGEHWEYLAPSRFTRATALLEALRRDLQIARGTDPIVLLRRLMGEIYARFEYKPHTTRVDSPIDEALAARSGVCQDFAHIFLALARGVGIPARYVSGYLFQNAGGHDRSAEGATHAWVEALLPDLGWIGLDPTNNLLVEDRHIRVAVGRDYADVPPTRGVYKGASAVRSELAVAVRVGPAAAASTDSLPFTPWMSRDAGAPPAQADTQDQQQQQ
jgi:transglutaminase-like putative cysteine protease